MNPFEEDWPWVVEQLERDPALQATTLFALLCTQHPGRYRPTQVRTLQRQSDFTHMDDLGVTLAGSDFPHLLFHSVLTYSNVEAVSLCFGETFEAPSRGIEYALWQFGGVPLQHRTDHLSAAVRQLQKRAAGGVDGALPGAHAPLWHGADDQQRWHRA